MSGGSSKRAAAKEYQLERVRKIPPSRKPVARKCIRCGQSFKSEHVGHRMCTDCRLRPSE